MKEMLHLIESDDDGDEVEIDLECLRRIDKMVNTLTDIEAILPSREIWQNSCHPINLKSFLARTQ